MENLHLNINLSFQQLVEVIKQLSSYEKLKLNKAIWSEEMKIPEEHQRLLLGRIQKAKQNPERMLDWGIASKKVRN